MAYWQATVDGKHYTVTIIDRFVRLTMSDGTKEGTGGNDVPAPRFLRSERLKSHVLGIYGQEIFREVVSAAEKAAELPMTTRERPDNSLKADAPFGPQP